MKNWGRWGADDQLGSVNLITPAKRKQALSLAKTGQTVSLVHNPLTDKADDKKDASPSGEMGTADTGRVPVPKD